MTGRWLGRTLGGRFVVEGLLGVGGMGSVFSGRDDELEQAIVVKVPHENLLSSAEFRERFQRERRSLVTLQHPYIVPILSAAEMDGVPYLVLRHLPGGNMKTRRKKSPGERIAPGKAVTWLKGIAAALDYAHAKGVIHRDVKPANVLFDEGDNAVLSDFGIARLATTSDVSATATGQWLGTPTYMAPEQYLTRAAVDGRADQYALAATLYEAVAGRPPIHEDEEALILAAKLRGEETPLAQVRPDLPAPFVSVVQRALATDPEARYPTCVEFLEACSAALLVSRGAEVLDEDRTVLRRPDAPSPTPQQETHATPPPPPKLSDRPPPLPDPPQRAERSAAPRGPTRSQVGPGGLWLKPQERWFVVLLFGGIFLGAVLVAAIIASLSEGGRIHSIVVAAALGGALGVGQAWYLRRMRVNRLHWLLATGLPCVGYAIFAGINFSFGNSTYLLLFFAWAAAQGWVLRRYAKPLWLWPAATAGIGIALAVIYRHGDPILWAYFVGHGWETSAAIICAIFVGVAQGAAVGFLRRS